MSDQPDNFYNPFLEPDEGADADTAPFTLGDALEAINKMPEGRAVIWAVLSQAGVYNANFAGNSRDVHAGGKRALGVWLIDVMGAHDPMMYPKMLLDVARSRTRTETKDMNNG